MVASRIAYWFLLFVASSTSFLAPYINSRTNKLQVFLAEGNSAIAEERGPTDSTQPTTKKKTLYEVLGADPSDTREVLKQKYTDLAKISHPDAIRSRIGGEDAAESTPDFSEIAAAWRILSDKMERKRYDRSLKAEEFSDNILNWVGDMAKQAAPVVKEFGSAANTIFRKTTATTLAGVQAAATRVGRTSTTGISDGALRKDDTRNSFSDAFKTAAEAARIAGRAVDSMDLLEKSTELETQALGDHEEASKAKEALKEVVERRLRMSLHTPGSGLTSTEANVILEDFTQTIPDDLSAWDLVMLKRTVEDEIKELQNEESAFVASQLADTEAQDRFQRCVQDRLKAEQDLRASKKAEHEAKLAYEQAQKRVETAQAVYALTSQQVHQAESQAKKSDWEIGVRSLSLERQSEKVRVALKHKERQVREALGMDNSPVEDKGGAERIQLLNDMRDEERLKAQAIDQRERMAEQLKLRAKELRERAERLERHEELEV